MKRFAKYFWICWNTATAVFCILILIRHFTRHEAVHNPPCSDLWFKPKAVTAIRYTTNRGEWTVTKAPMVSVPISVADVGTNRILIEVAEEGTNIVTYINGKPYGTNHLGDNFYKAISATHDRNLSFYMEEDMRGRPRTQ